MTNLAHTTWSVSSQRLAAIGQWRAPRMVAPPRRTLRCLSGSSASSGPCKTATVRWRWPKEPRTVVWFHLCIWCTKEHADACALLHVTHTQVHCCCARMLLHIIPAVHQEEKRRLLWAWELSADEVAAKVVSKLQPLFASHRLIGTSLTIDTSPVWHLRALLLAIADWPVERHQAAQQQATPAPASQIDIVEALKQALTGALASRSGGAPQAPTEADFDTSSLSAQSQIAAAPPHLSFVKSTVECKREPSPSPRVCRRGCGGSTALRDAPAEKGGALEEMHPKTRGGARSTYPQNAQRAGQFVKHSPQHYDPHSHFVKLQ